MSDTEGGNAYEQMVVAEVFGNASESDRAALAANPHQWRDALASLAEQTQATLTRIAAERSDLSARGSYRASEWAALTTELDSRRARTVNFRRRITERLRYVKQVVRDQNVAIDNQWRNLAMWAIDQFDIYDRPEMDEVPEALRPAYEVALRVLDRAAEAG